MKVWEMLRYIRGNPCTLLCVAKTEYARHKTVQALSPVILEAEVRKLEKEGWLRVGGMALATPVVETKPSYWVQTMSRNPFPAPGRNGKASRIPPKASS